MKILYITKLLPTGGRAGPRLPYEMGNGLSRLAMT